MNLQAFMCPDWALPMYAMIFMLYIGMLVGFKYTFDLLNECRTLQQNLLNALEKSTATDRNLLHSSDKLLKMFNQAQAMERRNKTTMKNYLTTGYGKFKKESK